MKKLPYKSGDRVVIVNDKDSKRLGINNGDVLIVDNHHAVDPWVWCDCVKSEVGAYYEDWEIVPEEIYNSPLYRAMREE